MSAHLLLHTSVVYIFTHNLRKFTATSAIRMRRKMNNVKNLTIVIFHVESAVIMIVVVSEKANRKGNP